MRRRIALLFFVPMLGWMLMPSPGQGQTPPAVTPGPSPTAAAPLQTQQPDSASQTVEATPQALEAQYIRFQPHFPLMPGTFNIEGYEREKVGKGAPIVSPDRSRMVVSEVYFLPDIRQTVSRAYLMPVGRQPALSDLLPPEKLAALQAEQQRLAEKGQPGTPQIDPKTVDPQLFWDRYRPEKQMAYRQAIFERGFGKTAPFRSEIIQVVDWSGDGARLLMVYRPGIHHMGLYKTIPVLYHVDNGETVRFSLLPNLVWQDMLKRNPELKGDTSRTWDIRPLGWARQDAMAIVVKLVLFEGQSESPAGFWQYSTRTGALQYLGAMISPDEIARNGWRVSFVDPAAPGGPKTYGPGETPPPKSPEANAPKRKSWRKRLQFWKE